MTVNELRSNGWWILVCSGVVCAESIEGLQKNNEWVTYSKIEWKQLHHSLTLVLTALVQYISNKEKRSLRDMVFYFPVYSRAIHLEMIDDMTTDSFINALRAFIAIRGNVCQLRCDLGSNFVGARREFGELMKGMDQERVKALGCEFLMNPPAASHMRSVLSAVLDQSAQRLDSTSLRTFLYEVMALVNSRPLTTEHLNDPSGPEPLTPNQIITMKSTIILPPPGPFTREDLYLRKRWHRVQYLAN